jgi:hypothetical protein
MHPTVVLAPGHLGDENPLMCGSRAAVAVPCGFCRGHQETAPMHAILRGAGATKSISAMIRIIGEGN